MVRVPVQATRSTLPPTLLVKIARKPHLATPAEAMRLPQLREAAQAEYNLAVATWQAFEQIKDPHCAAVPTLAYLEEWNAVVMCELDGRPLKKWLTDPAIVLRRPQAWSQLLKNVGAAGRWLRIFHEGVGDVQRREFDFTAAEAALHQVLDRLEENSGGRVSKSGLQADMFQALKRLKGAELPVATMHGDFHYSNILTLTDGRVCAIDPYFEERYPVYFDLASLLMDPQTRPVQVFSSGLWIDANHLSMLQKVVLESYFQDKTANPDALFFHYGMALLYKWAGLEKDLSAARGVRGLIITLARPLVRRHFRRVLMRRLAHFG